MKAIAINGSPRKGGNTETLLRNVLEQIFMPQFAELCPLV